MFNQDTLNQNTLIRTLFNQDISWDRACIQDTVKTGHFLGQNQQDTASL